MSRTFQGQIFTRFYYGFNYLLSIMGNELLSKPAARLKNCTCRQDLETQNEAGSSSSPMAIDREDDEEEKEEQAYVVETPTIIVTAPVSRNFYLTLG